MTENLLQVWSNNFSGYIIHSNILWPLYVICYRYDEYTVVSDAKYCVKGKKRIFDCALTSAFFQKRTWTRKFGKYFHFKFGENRLICDEREYLRKPEVNRRGNVLLDFSNFLGIYSVQGWEHLHRRSWRFCYRFAARSGICLPTRNLALAKRSRVSCAHKVTTVNFQKDSPKYLQRSLKVIGNVAVR